MKAVVLRELGGAVHIETPGGGVVVASVLGPLACELIRTHYPALRARGVLILSGLGELGPPLLHQKLVDDLETELRVVEQCSVPIPDDVTNPAHSPNHGVTNRSRQPSTSR